MINSLRTYPARWAAGAVAGLAVLAWLAFGYFGVHTLFVDDVVSEAAPVFDAPAVEADEAATATSAAPSAEQPAATEAAPTTPPVTEAPAGDPVEATAPAIEAEAVEAPPVTTAAPTVPPTTAPAAPEIVTEAAGDFSGSGRYSTGGQAVVLGNGTGQRFLRFENFETSNGPDLNVYLVNSSTGDVSDFVDLGDLKGNIGEQNYEIPADVDLSVYDTVWVWCVRFGTGFGSAELTVA